MWEIEPKKSHAFEIDPIKFFYKMIIMIYNDLQSITMT